MRYILLLLFLAACGTDNDSASEAPNEQSEPLSPAGIPEAQLPYSMALQSDSVPQCDDTREAQLVYLLDTKVFQVCQAGAWVEISITPPEPEVEPQEEPLPPLREILTAFRIFNKGMILHEAPSEAVNILIKYSEAHKIDGDDDPNTVGRTTYFIYFYGPHYEELEETCSLSMHATIPTNEISYISDTCP